MNKLGTKLGAVAMSAVMALSFAPSAAITSLAAGDGLTDPIADSYQTVYVCYDANSGEHLWTTEKAEADWLVNEQGWLEGNPAWKAPSIAGEPVYRLYSPSTGEHHYTANKNEATWLEGLGWNNEKVAFLTPDPEDDGATPILCYRNPNGGRGAHQYTISEEEAEFLDGIGWGEEDPRFYGYELTFDPVVEELTVSIDNTTPKVADTLTATVVDRNGEDVSDNVTFQWYANDEAIEGADEETLFVDSDLLGAALKVVVTAENGNTFESDETDEVTCLTAEVSIVDASGLQADGTALAGDTLSIVLGADMGTPQNVTWYANDILALSSDFTSGVANLDLVTGKAAALGVDLVVSEGSVEVYAIVTTTSGEKVKTTNTITVTADEDVIEVSGIEILNDYDTPTLSYAAADAGAVVAVTLSKDVEGDLYIYKDAVTKFGSNNRTFKIAAADFAKAVPVTSLAALTAKNAVAKAADVTGGATNTGICYKNSDDSITYLIKAADTDMGARFSPTRGATYKAVFDQTNVSSDDIGTTTRSDVTVSESFTAPYIQAPASIALTSHSAGNKPKITFYDEEGEVLTWMTGAAPLNTNLGLNSVITYGESGSAKNKANKVTESVAALGSTVTEGVLTGNLNLHNGSTYFWATVTTVKGIYGASSETLESALVEGAAAPYTTMNLVDDSTNPKDAVLTFNSLKTAGTVYILNHAAGTPAQTAAINAFDADDLSTYAGKVDVEKGDTKVTISNVLSSYADSVANGTFYYTAYFVPHDTEEYATAYTTTFQNTKQKVKDATITNGLQVAQIPKSIAYDEEDTTTAEKVVSTATLGGLDKTTTISDAVSGSQIKAYDQFGDLMVTNQAAKTVTSCTAVNNTLTTTEDANAQFAIDTNGFVTINLYRGSAVDAGDGFDITILGTKVEMRATNGATDVTTAGASGVSSLWTVKIGSNTVVKAYNSEDTTIVLTSFAGADITTGATLPATITCTAYDQFGNVYKPSAVENVALTITDNDESNDGTHCISAATMSIATSGVATITITDDLTKAETVNDTVTLTAGPSDIDLLTFTCTTAQTANGTDGRWTYAFD